LQLPSLNSDPWKAQDSGRRLLNGGEIRLMLIYTTGDEVDLAEIDQWRQLTSASSINSSKKK